MDPLFRVEVISAMPNPQQIMYAAMHQDYSEGFVWDERESFPDEEHCGEVIVKRLLAGGRGHYGPLEHPQIVLNVGWFPHSVMQQIRTHRVGISFDVQSFRYSGSRISDVVSGKRTVEEVFYLRPIGSYTDRQGARYTYSESDREADLDWCYKAAERYQQMIFDGKSEEHARGTIPFDVRQHWLVSMNCRTMFHLMDLRWKPDAQLEAQQMCELMWPHFKAWVPAIAEWYESNRLHKGKLAP